MPPRVLVSALVACLLLVAAGPAQAAAADCPGAESDPGATPPRAVIAATLCLVNVERTRRGREPLTRDGRLDRAARRHAEDMVARQYFAHRDPDGQHPADRIRASGYLASATAWMVGENLAWGTHELAAPRAIVAAWMASPGHRANILRPRYRHIGLGVAPGNPAGADGPGATYATTFGQAARARRGRR